MPKRPGPVRRLAFGMAFHEVFVPPDGPVILPLSRGIEELLFYLQGLLESTIRCSGHRQSLRMTLIPAGLK